MFFLDALRARLGTAFGGRHDVGIVPYAGVQLFVIGKKHRRGMQPA